MEDQSETPPTEPVESLAETWPTAYDPDLPPRNPSHLGMLEAVAWIASRDYRLSDAVYRRLYADRHERRSDGHHFFATRNSLSKALWASHGTSICDAEDELFAACANEEIEAFGWYDSPSYKKMAPSDWIEVRPSWGSVDGLEPKHAGMNLFGEPRWSHIRLLCEDVLRLWPELEGPAPELRREPSRADVRKWVRERIKEGDAKEAVVEARAASFPNNKTPPREMVREIYDDEFFDIKGRHVGMGRRRRSDQ